MSVRSGLKALAGHVRDLWLALGIALLAFLLLEGAYVAPRAAREAISGSHQERLAQQPGHPYQGQAWFRQLIRERDGQKKKFDPWRTYWGSPVAGKFVNVDSAGRRVTIPSKGAPGARSRVFLLGGSAMWGYTNRDSLTIPSLVAQTLHAEGLPNVEVLNLAQPGYTIGQELITLQLELTRGNVPSVAVFLDGVNDIRTALRFTEPGHVFFETRLRQLYEVQSNQGVIGSMVTAGIRSALINRMLLAVGASKEWAEPPSPPTLCHDLAEYYRNVAGLAVAAGRQAGFDVLLFLQPMHATTRKPLTTFEQSITGNPKRDETIRTCAASIDSAMAPERGSTWASLSDAYDSHRETVYLDTYGHVTEDASRILAKRIAAEVSARIRAAGGDSR